MGKPSERMSNFWTVRFLKTESKQNVGFLHISSTYQTKIATRFTTISKLSSSLPVSFTAYLQYPYSEYAIGFN